eukprot:TRINITY_DN10436_c0_g1_i2.p1 TRINITY_DN10436_c0_g1~~TRINITY_DN10436_c0_g1_i2.p1  ORF type:complete len:117 (-),score=19.96 TRINITY_DN10436_c0_g1_i2:175-525(-)
MVILKLTIILCFYVCFCKYTQTDATIKNNLVKSGEAKKKLHNSDKKMESDFKEELKDIKKEEHKVSEKKVKTSALHSILIYLLLFLPVLFVGLVWFFVSKQNQNRIDRSVEVIFEV